MTGEARLTGSLKTMKILRRAPLPAPRRGRGLPGRRRLMAARRRRSDRDLRAADRQRALLAGRHRLHALLRDAARSSPASRWRWPSAAACSTSAPRGSSTSPPSPPPGWGSPSPGLLGLAAGPALLPRRRSSPARSGAAMPGVLKARFGAHEVITTIMMNFIAVALASYFTQYHYKTPGDPILQTVPIGAGAHIARLGTVHARASRSASRSTSPFRSRSSPACSSISSSGARAGATRSGPPARTRRRRSTAASRPRRQIVLAMAVSGGLAGMVAINEVLGYRYRYYDGFSAGYGFTGIAVALLGRNHPVGVLLAALLFGALPARRALRRHLHRERLEGPGAGAPGDHHPLRGGGGAVPRTLREAGAQGAYERNI